MMTFQPSPIINQKCCKGHTYIVISGKTAASCIKIAQQRISLKDNRKQNEFFSTKLMLPPSLSPHREMHSDSSDLPKMRSSARKPCRNRVSKLCEIRIVIFTNKLY
jgi:hypothetical protein